MMLAFGIATITHNTASAFAQNNIEISGSSLTQNSAVRIALNVNGARTIVLDEPVILVTVIDPTIVKTEVQQARHVTFTALAEGETIVIVSGNSHRQVFAVGVKGPIVLTPEQIAVRVARAQRALYQPAGSYSMSFSPPYGGGPALLRQTFDYRRKFSHDRLLRIEGNMFNFFGRGDRRLTYSAEPGFGLDRLSVGVDAPDGRLDLLDSELNVSPLSLNSYTMRGVHLVSNEQSRLRGLEFFAGLARPSINLVENSAGYLSGLLLPIAKGKSWQMRGGVLAIAPRGDLPSQKGFVWHLDARYSPNADVAAVSEADYANGALSWRLRLDLRRGPFDIYGESSRLSGRSPLVGIGAGSGRNMTAIRVGWQPNARLSASFSYNITASELFRSNGAKLDSSTLFANVSSSLSRNSRLGIHFTQQQIDTRASDLAGSLKLETRSLGLSHNIQFGRRWSNDFEGTLTSSRERAAGAGLERGITLRDELRHSWERWSGSAYVNYAHNTPSLANLIVRNPQLLPPALRPAFETDPGRFILVNRDALPLLLAGVELPSTRSLDIGLRAQGAFSRYNLSGDVRYSSGEILGNTRRDVVTNVGISFRLDAANSVQFNGARAFTLSGYQSPSTLTLSYTHRFGAGSGEGFHFSRLFGLDRGRIQGRVFFDLNCDGRDDPGEPGIANMKVSLDAKHSVITDKDGRFNFSGIRAADYNVVLSSDDLGVSVRASTPTEQSVFVSSGETIKVSFGVTNFGFVSGRIFNDLSLTGEQGDKNMPGVAGVRIKLCPGERCTSASTVTVRVDASGMYEFRNLAPGKYQVEIELMTVPANFQMPARSSWTLNVEPLKGTYLDIPLSAQRAIAGIVFRDKDNDGTFDPNKDEALAGARVMAQGVETVSDQNGSYILRNLPAGKTVVLAQLPSGSQSAIVTLTLPPEPDIRRGINLIIAGTKTSVAATK